MSSEESQEIKNLKKQLAEAQRNADVFKGCTDGSYEAACIAHGVYRLKAKLENLQENKKQQING